MINFDSLVLKFIDIPTSCKNSNTLLIFSYYISYITKLIIQTILPLHARYAIIIIICVLSLFF